MIKRTVIRLVLATAMSGLILPTGAAFAADKLLSLGLGFEFTSGNYGTAANTDSVLVPLTVAVTPTDRLAFSVEIPYLRQSNTNVVAGQFRRTMGQTSTTSMTAAMGTPGSGAGMGGTSGTTSRDTSKAQSGLGDITLRAGYVLVEEGDAVPQIRPNIVVKAPTADKDRGLGTGKFDEGLAIEFSKWFGDWQVAVEPGYTIQGNADGFALKNYFSCNGGIGYQLTEKLMPALIIKTSTPLLEGATALVEGRLKLSYQATQHIGIELYAAKGITTSTPDYSTGLTVFYDL